MEPRLFRELQGAYEDFVFVMGGYPVVSNSGDGDVMRNTSLPDMLREFEVSAYISGEDKNLQHLVVDGVHHFTAGAAGVSATSVSRQGQEDRSVYTASDNGFLVCYVSESDGGTATCQFRSSSNTVLHEATLAPRTRLGPWLAEVADSARAPSGQCWQDTVLLFGDDPDAVAAGTADLVTSTTTVVSAAGTVYPGLVDE